MKFLFLFTQLLAVGYFIFCSTWDKKSTKENFKQSITIITSFQYDSDHVTFKYNKVDLIGLSGTSVISKKTISKSGKVEFYKKEVRFYENNDYKKFSIDEIVHQPDGVQIKTKNTKGDKCMITIIRRQNIDFVNIHHIENEKMELFHIIDGFTLNLELYKNN